MKSNISQNRLVFLVVIIFITCFGAVTQYLAFNNMFMTYSSFNIEKFIIPFIICWLFFLSVQFIPISRAFKYKWVWLGFAVFLVVITAYFGITINGVKNWISIGTFYFHSGYWILFFYILFLASKYNEKKIVAAPTKSSFILNTSIESFLTVVLLFFLFVFVEKQIFFALVSIFIVNLIINKTRKWIVISVTTAFIIFTVFLLSNNYRFDHIFAYYTKCSPQGSSYQNTQCLESFKIGGITGIGIRPSQRVESNNRYLLPYPTTHTTFAVVIEHFGIIGGLLTILFFVYFVYFGLRVYRKNREDSEEFLMLLLLSLLMFFNTFHILNNIGLFPFGSILSFFSKVRDFNIISMITAGLIYKIAGKN